MYTKKLSITLQYHYFRFIIMINNFEYFQITLEPKPVLKEEANMANKTRITKEPASIFFPCQIS